MLPKANFISKPFQQIEDHQPVSSLDMKLSSRITNCINNYANYIANNILIVYGTSCQLYARDIQGFQSDKFHMPTNMQHGIGRSMRHPNRCFFRFLTIMISYGIYKFFNVKLLKPNFTLF